MRLQKDLDELIAEGIISKETAGNISDFYKRKSSNPHNRLFVVFGILGALLVGLGVVLIIAHNWDNLSYAVRTALAFLPLLAGQSAAAFALWKRADSRAWTEATAVFLFFSIAACISLISQIYNIPGNLGGFLLTWSLLGLPVVYLLNSSVASLLYLIAITWFGCEAGYWSGSDGNAQLYWLLLLLIAPFYYRLMRKAPQSNFTVYHHFFVPLSVVVCLGTVAADKEIIMFLAYSSLFGVLYLVGNIPLLQMLKRRSNGYLLLGSLGTVGLFLAFTFEGMWDWLQHEKDIPGGWLVTPEFYTSLILFLSGLALLAANWKRRFEAGTALLDATFVVFAVTFIVGWWLPAVAMLLANLLVLVIGIQIIRKGAKQDHLGVVNYGLMVVAALIVCRFFDTNLSFVLRGLLFILVGAGFFMANYLFLKRRKTHEV